MSEHDIKLGGMAATKFGGTAKNAYDHDSGNTGYKTSDQVREFYMHELEKKAGSGTANSINSSSSAEARGGTSNVPDFWAERQKERDLQAKQMGVFSNRQTDMSKNEPTAKSGKVEGGDSSLSAEVALVRIATNTLQTMAKSLQGKSIIKIPMEDRAAFASAMKQAMDALAKSA